MRGMVISIGVWNWGTGNPVNAARDGRQRRRKRRGRRAYGHKSSIGKGTSQASSTILQAPIHVLIFMTERRLVGRGGRIGTRGDVVIKELKTVVAIGDEVYGTLVVHHCGVWNVIRVRRFIIMGLGYGCMVDINVNVNAVVYGVNGVNGVVVVDCIDVVDVIDSAYVANVVDIVDVIDDSSG